MNLVIYNLEVFNISCDISFILPIETEFIMLIRSAIIKFSVMDLFLYLKLFLVETDVNRHLLIDLNLVLQYLIIAFLDFLSLYLNEVWCHLRLLRDILPCLFVHSMLIQTIGIFLFNILAIVVIYFLLCSLSIK